MHKIVNKWIKSQYEDNNEYQIYKNSKLIITDKICTK